MADTSHVRTVRERVIALLKADSDFDKVPIEEGPTDLVKLNFPCIVVAVVAQRFYPITIGGKYDRELTVRVDCYEKERDPEASMEKVEALAEDVVDCIMDNYSLSLSGSRAVRLAANYTITYDLIEATQLVLRNAGVIFTTEIEK